MATKAVTAARGHLSYEYKKSVGFSIPSNVAYGTWEWKYRFPKGRTPYTGVANKKLGAGIISAPNVGAYSRDFGSDGHSWFTRPGKHPEHHLLHNVQGGWGVGLFVDDKWHVCRITRDPKKGFTIYHDNRIIGSGFAPSDPSDNGKNGLFTEVKDDTLKTSEKFALSMMAAESPGSVDVDDIRIYDVVLPAPKDAPLRELYAIHEGKDVAKLPPLTNYAGAKAGATASSDTKDATPGQAPQHVIDGVTTDHDGGKGYGYANWPGYLTVRLKQTRALEEIYISLWDFPTIDLSAKFPGPRKYDLEVEVSVDGKNWTNVATMTKAAEIQRIPLGGRKVGHIRLRGKYYSEYRHWSRKFPAEPEVQKVVDEFYVVEVEAYGPAEK